MVGSFAFDGSIIQQTREKVKGRTKYFGEKDGELVFGGTLVFEKKM
jgi:hypothetical protein